MVIFNGCIFIVYYAIDSSLDAHNKSTYRGTGHFMSHGGDMTFKFHSDLAIGTMWWEKHRAGNAASHSLAYGELGSN